jgi:hypothetical protein
MASAKCSAFWSASASVLAAGAHALPVLISR